MAEAGDAARVIGEIVTQEKYGLKVKANSLMEQLRPSECLCLNCRWMPDEQCDSAKALYEICCRFNLALAVTRCPRFMQLEEGIRAEP